MEPLEYSGKLSDAEFHAEAVEHIVFGKAVEQLFMVFKFMLGLGCLILDNDGRDLAAFHAGEEQARDEFEAEHAGGTVAGSHEPG